MTKIVQNVILTFLMIILYLSFMGQAVAEDRVFLVTGFEPFHGDSINPSWEAVQLLPEQIGHVRLIKLKLPVSYVNGFVPLQEAIKRYKPIGILAVGVANIQGLKIEKQAYNLDDDIWADNNGTVRTRQAIMRNSPAVLGITNQFPIDKIVTDLSQSGFVINKSNDPGRFLCNHIFYLMLHELSNDNGQIPAGFIHVPPLSYYSVNQDELALEASIKIILENLGFVE